MKKLLIVGLCFVSSASFGAVLCDKGTAQQANLTAGGASDFVKTSFPVKCSSNVYLDVLQNAVAIAAAGGSAKGKNVFGGTSAGGTVSAVIACTVTGCTSGDVSGQTQALLDKAT